MLRLRGDLPPPSPTAAVPPSWRKSAAVLFSRVEAAAFLGAAELAAGDLAAATSALEPRSGSRGSAHRAVVRASHPRDARGREAGRRRSRGARALLSEARELVDRGRGWRLGAFDVALAWVRLLASEPTSDRTAIESALESLDALTAELGSDPYRRIAALERARLAT